MNMSDPGPQTSPLRIIMYPVPERQYIVLHSPVSVSFDGNVSGSDIEIVVSIIPGVARVRKRAAAFAWHPPVDTRKDVHQVGKVFRIPIFLVQGYATGGRGANVSSQNILAISTNIIAGKAIVNADVQGARMTVRLVHLDSGKAEAEDMVSYDNEFLLLSS